MRKIFLFFPILLFILLIKTQIVFAGEFSTTLIRLSRQAPSTTTGALICTTTPSTDNGTETSVQVIFPNSFTVNTSPSNWTVDTSDIPNGATAWPGISTATSVSGSTVTFPSSNLAASTQYCFSTSETNTLTTPSATESYSGTVRTRNGSTVIDSGEFGIAITTNDQIDVTATVPANPTDFSSSLAITSHSINDLLREDTQVSYNLTYGSNLSYPATITVEAEWSLGTVVGAALPTEDIVEYVVGSASNAYNNTQPVVDITNRKVTWTITNFPGSTNSNSVSFRIRTKNTYTSSSKVNFTITGRVVSTGTSSPDSSLTSTYQYSPFITPTIGPTSSSTSSTTSTPTPTPPQTTQNLFINQIEIRTVSSTQAAVFVKTSKNSTVKINYSQDQNSLDKVATSNTLAPQHVLTLGGLSPGKKYYFRVLVRDITGKSASSELFTLTTSTRSTIPKALTSTLIITSGDTILSSQGFDGKIPTIVLPISTDYSFRINVDDYKAIKSIKAILRNSNVLGVSTAYASSESLVITEISPGQYIGTLSSTPRSGTYNLILQVQDHYGNISEQAISVILVVEPMRFINSLTKSGIERVKVTLQYYNNRLRTFSPLNTSTTSIENPVFSDRDGKVNFVLPEGKYRLTAEVLGFKIKTMDFEIGIGRPNYPTIELFPLPFSIMTYLQYSFNSLVDILETFKNYLHTIRTSVRYFDLISLTTIALFISLSIMQLARKLCVPIHHLPYFAYYHIASFVSKSSHATAVRGKVVSMENGDAVDGVLLYLALPSGKILSHTSSNGDGEFFAKINNVSDIRLTISKKDYKSYSSIISKKNIKDKLTIVLKPIQKPAGFNIKRIYWYVENLVGSLFEAILVGTLFIELLFALDLGILRVAPFIVLSSFNIILWAAVTRKN